MNTKQKITSLFGVTHEQMNSRTRKEKVCFARQMHWLILRNQYDFSLEKIGRFYDNRDRSTIYAGIKRIEGLIEVDPYAKKIYEEVINNKKNFK